MLFSIEIASVFCNECQCNESDCLRDNHTCTFYQKRGVGWGIMYLLFWFRLNHMNKHPCHRSAFHSCAVFRIPAMEKASLMTIIKLSCWASLPYTGCTCWRNLTYSLQLKTALYYKNLYIKDKKVWKDHSMEWPEA